MIRKGQTVELDGTLNIPNCTLTTGTTTLSGAAAPPGAEWSEVAQDETDPLTANTTAGFGVSGALRLADDFAVTYEGHYLGNTGPETAAAFSYDDWQEGRDPAGITTQDPELAKRLDPVRAGRRLANYLKVMTLEAQTIARACGKSHVHNLEPEDLVALTVEAAAMAQVPLSGTNWIPGKGVT